MSRRYALPLVVVAFSFGCVPTTAKDPSSQWAGRLTNGGNFSETAGYLRNADSLGARQLTAQCESQGRRDAGNVLARASFVNDPDPWFMPQADFDSCKSYRRERACSSASPRTKERIPPGIRAHNTCTLTDGVRVCLTTLPSKHATCLFKTEVWAGRWAGPTPSPQDVQPIQDEDYRSAISGLMYGGTGSSEEAPFK